MKRFWLVPFLNIVLVLFLAAAVFLSPLPVWVLAVPLASHIGWQLVGYFGGKGADFWLGIGDYIYYLAIGTVVGLGGLLLQNSQGFSTLLNDTAFREQQNEIAKLNTQGVSLRIQIETQQSVIEFSKVELERAQVAANGLDPDLITQCLAEQFSRNLSEQLDPSHGDILGSDLDHLPDFEIPPPACAATMFRVELRNQAADRLAADREHLRLLFETLAETVVKVSEAEIALEKKQQRQWFWETISEDRRREFLFFLFPCILLIGVTIKLGKTTRALRKLQKE